MEFSLRNKIFSIAQLNNPHFFLTIDPGFLNLNIEEMDSRPIGQIFFRFISLLVFASLLTPLLDLRGQEEPVVEAETKVPAESTEMPQKELFEAFGWLLGQEKALYIGYTDEELTHIINGLIMGARGGPGPENIKEAVAQVEDMIRQRLAAFQERQEKLSSSQAAENMVSEETFFAQLEKKPGIQKTASGLYYELIDEGIGRKPEGEDWMRLNYTGMLVNGQVFDSTADRGQPADLNLDQLLPGFAEGLRLVREMGKIKLYIPARLGYRERSAGMIPPNSTLIFEVELLEVNPDDLQLETE